MRCDKASWIVRHSGIGFDKAQNFLKDLWICIGALVSVAPWTQSVAQCIAQCVPQCVAQHVCNILKSLCESINHSFDTARTRFSVLIAPNSWFGHVWAMMTCWLRPKLESICLPARCSPTLQGAESLAVSTNIAVLRLAVLDIPPLSSHVQRRASALSVTRQYLQCSGSWIVIVKYCDMECTGPGEGPGEGR